MAADFWHMGEMISALVLVLSTAAPPASLFSDADALYQKLHQAPELSGKEVATSQKMAELLKAAGFTVTTKVGGHGVVGVLKNGAGPTVLVRTDLDGLPLEEKTGLPYASKNKGVMHGCGHDVHMTVWSSVAKWLASEKNEWSGTLVFVGQPSEESGDGAKAMLKDGLLTKFPKPDVAVALHNHAGLAAGKVGWVEGYALAAVDSVDVTLFGKGGHGAYPHTTVDPVVMAAKTVLSLQTLVARENNPLHPAVLTVGSIHAGTKHNIISDEAKLQLTLRSYDPKTREALREGVVRIAKAESLAARAPKEPEVIVDAGPDAVFNDPKTTQRLVKAVGAALGETNVVGVDRVMGAEDFGEYARQGGFPGVMLWLGTVDPARLEGAPSLHSPLFAPQKKATLETGITVLHAAVRELLRN
jgi:amidohydrolase